MKRSLFARHTQIGFSRLWLVALFASLLYGAGCSSSSPGNEPRCDNGICEFGEDFDTCPADCTDSCGNTICDAGENSTTCPGDCPSQCGDGSCTSGEDSQSCPADCVVGCGDSTCDADEDAVSCPQDCEVQCGDDICSHNETPALCEQDCPAQCGDSACTHTETASDCPEDCPAQCGDSVCTHTETVDCPQDCCENAVANSLTVDIPRVQVSFSFTLGDAAYTDVSGIDGWWNVNIPYVTVKNLDEPSDRFTLSLFEFTQDSTDYDWTVQTANHTRWMVPGHYQVIYNAGSGHFVDDWPLNTEAPVNTSLSLEQDGAIIIDIPRVRPSFDFTLGGNAYSNVSGTDGWWNVNIPYLTVINEVEPTDRFQLSLFGFTAESTDYDWTVQSLSHTRWMIPSDYRMVYNAGSNHFVDDWPLNTEAPVGTPLSVQANTTYTVDVPRVQPSFEFTLGGNSYDDISGTDGWWNVNIPYLTVINEAEGSDRFQLSLFGFSADSTDYDWTVQSVSHTRWLVPGNYKLIYNAGSSHFIDDWPLNTEAPVGNPLAVQANTTYAVNIPRVRPTFDFTLGGNLYSDISGTDGWWNVNIPYLTVINEAEGSDRFQLSLFGFSAESTDYDWTVQTVSHTRWMVPGNYRMVYNAGSGHFVDDWPLNTEAPVGASLAVQANTNYTVDIPRVRPNFGFTLGGSSYTNISGTDGWWNVNIPYLTVINQAENSDRFQLSLFNFTSDSTDYDWTVQSVTHTRWMVPSEYRMVYNAGSSHFVDDWPLNTEAPVGQPLAVQNSSGYTVDIPRIEPTIDFTLGGASYADVSGIDGWWNVNIPYVTAINAAESSDRFNLSLFGFSADSTDYDWTVQSASHTRWLVPGSYRMVYNAGSNHFVADWPLNNEAPVGCIYLSP